MVDRPWKRAVSAFLTVIIVAGALYSAFFFFSTVRAIIAQVPLPFSERVVLAGGNPGQEGDSEASLSENGKTIVFPRRQLDERVNVLLLGIDQREGERGPWRTDTMILVSLDPKTNTAAMLSIPRDLWTTIPGYGESRINTAHFTGDARGYPGGGPALAKKTVWFALGVPVHNYVRVDFAGFEQLVDAIGGLTIDVPEAIYDARYPTEDFGTKEIRIPAGLQHMDGQMALQYARTRHGGSDFDRMDRQRQVLMAARDKVMALDIPLTRIPTVLDLVGSSVQTDLTLEEMFLLADAMRKVDRGDIRSAAIDNSMTTTVVTPQGWMVEVADWDKVRDLVNDLFPVAGSANESTSLTADRLDQESARVAVQNGTGEPGVAAAVAEHLVRRGFDVITYQDADHSDYDQSLILAYREKPYTLAALADEIGIDAEAILYHDAPDESLDVVVIIGRDLLQSAIIP